MMMKRGKKRNEGKIVCDDNDERLCCSCHTRLILDDARKRKKVSYTKLLHETSAGKEVSWRTGEVKSEEYWMSPRLSMWCSFSRQQMKKTAHRRWQCLLLVPSFQTFKRWISMLFRVEKTTQERERDTSTLKKRKRYFSLKMIAFSLLDESCCRSERGYNETHTWHMCECRERTDCFVVITACKSQLVAVPEKSRLQTLQKKTL